MILIEDYELNAYRPHEVLCQSCNAPFFKLNKIKVINMHLKNDKSLYLCDSCIVNLKEKIAN